MFRPQVEQLETRDCPSGGFPVPPPGQQVIMFQDIVNNSPFMRVLLQFGWKATPAEPTQIEPYVDVGSVLHNAFPNGAVIPSGYTADGNAYWFVANSKLPPQFTPGTTSAAFTGSASWLGNSALIVDALTHHDT